MPSQAEVKKYVISFTISFIKENKWLSHFFMNMQSLILIEDHNKEFLYFSHVNFIKVNN